MARLTNNKLNSNGPKKTRQGNSRNTKRPLRGRRNLSRGQG